MKKVFLFIVIAILAAAFGRWTVSPLLIDVEVNDAVPVGETMSPAGDVMSRAFPIQDTALHPATGSVRIIESDGQTIVRYEDYDGTSGPDLYVYLAKDLAANEFVSLGPARGNKGNMNYVVPEDVDISEYRYVLTWSKRFSTLFDYAEIK